MDASIAPILDEGRWLAVSLIAAMIGVTILLSRRRHEPLQARRRILAAMSLGAGLTIGTMAFGHLLAVTVKLLAGTLAGPAPWLYMIGFMLAVPSWWLILHAPRIGASPDHDRRTLILNAGVAASLLLLGPHNLPLAVPAMLNVAYVLHTGRVVGWLLVGSTVVVNAGLLAGAVVFWMSGQSFEQFSGMTPEP